MARAVVSRTTIWRRCLACLTLAVVAACTAILTRAQSGLFSTTTAIPGRLDDGSTLLANGWRVAPAGKHLGVGTLPLNIVATPDNRYAIVTTNGLQKPALHVVDLANWTIKNTYTLDNAWYGLAFSVDGTKLYVGGASLNNVQEFAYADGTLTRARTFALP